MNNKVLFVDDEIDILNSYKRNFRNKFNVSIAAGAKEALQIIHDSGPYAVIVSDMQMPLMNGIEFLTITKKKYRETIRIMLTGDVDQRTAVLAMNQGDIFQFLNKPCKIENLEMVIVAALAQHRLIIAEKELLENTLKGSIELIIELLSITKPAIFGCVTRLKKNVRKIVNEMSLPDLWFYETLALLSKIGCVVISENLILKKSVGGVFKDDEAKAYAEHVLIGSSLLSKIPRMERFSECIYYQEKYYDGTGFPKDNINGQKLPLGARIMRIALDFDNFQVAGLSKTKTIERMKFQKKRYDPELLEAFINVNKDNQINDAIVVKIKHLTSVMVLVEDIRTKDGILLLCEGQPCTLPMRQHLECFFSKGDIHDDILVREILD